ncbi:MAG: acyltransferase family protein, partial [Candidatus Thorarchaeota archaeon]|nr:acyltransferase family protein [Candidatus Thorarchaeota archaeon]
EPKRPYYFQLDVLKAIAIAFVVMDHSLTWEIKGAMGSLFWERLSIPFFLIVMGFNMAYSFRYSGASTLRELYSWEYFKRKFKRYVFPFAILYVGSILVGMATGVWTFNEYTLLGTLPFWGPGNWFIAVLFGSIVVFPVTYWIFKKHPALTLVLCFLGEIVLQAIMYIWFPYPIDSALEGFVVAAIRLNIVFFLPAVGLGLWFSKGYSLWEKRNWFMYVYLPISVMFMVDYVTISPGTHRGVLGSLPNSIGDFFNFVQEFIVGDYTLIFYGYAAFLFLIAMMLIPKKATGSFQRFVQRVGRASYHILLFQIFYMSILYHIISFDDAIHHQIPNFALEMGWPLDLFYIPFYLINLTICFTGGLLWYGAEKWSTAKGKPWWKSLLMKRTGFLFGSLMSIVLIDVSIDIIGEAIGFNEITSPGAIASILAIIFFISVSIALMYKAFTMGDDDVTM